MLKHRNSQKRIYFKDACYFVTCKTHNNFPYFRERIFCDLFMENLRICKQLKGFLLYGWVLLHNHFHLLVQPDDKWNYSEIMRSIKTNFSCTSNRIIHPEGAVTSPRLQWVYRDKLDILHYQKRFNEKFPVNHQFPEPCLPAGRFQWQKSFHDHYIRNENDFDYHMEYITYNPIKHGLPVNWPYVYTNPEYEDLTEKI